MKDEFIRVRVNAETKKRSEDKARRRGFENISQYVRALIEKDLKATK